MATLSHHIYKYKNKASSKAKFKDYMAMMTEEVYNFVYIYLYTNVKNTFEEKLKRF